MCGGVGGGAVLDKRQKKVMKYSRQHYPTIITTTTMQTIECGRDGEGLSGGGVFKGGACRGWGREAEEGGGGGCNSIARSMIAKQSQINKPRRALSLSPSLPPRPTGPSSLSTQEV